MDEHLRKYPPPAKLRSCCWRRAESGIYAEEIGVQSALCLSRCTCRARQCLNDAFHRGVVVRSGEEPRLKSTWGKVYASIKHGVEKCRVFGGSRTLNIGVVAHAVLAGTKGNREQVARRLNRMIHPGIGKRLRQRSL